MSTRKVAGFQLSLWWKLFQNISGLSSNKKKMFRAFCQGKTEMALATGRLLFVWYHEYQRLLFYGQLNEE